MNKKKPAKDELSEEEIRKKITLEYKGGMKIEDIAVENQYHIKSVQRIVRNFLGKKSYKRRKKPEGQKTHSSCKNGYRK